MARTSIGSVEGLIKILSAEVLPLYPKLREQRWQVELERYIQELHQYLRRQNGKFTAQNLINTIGGGNSPFFEIKVAYHYVGTNTVTFSVDATRDWRDYAFLNFSKMSTTRNGLRGVTTLDKDSGEYSGETSDLVVMDDGTLRVTVNVDGTTGEISCTITNGPTAHEDYYILITLEAYALIPNSGDFVSKGNGL